MDVHAWNLGEISFELHLIVLKEANPLEAGVIFEIQIQIIVDLRANQHPVFWTALFLVYFVVQKVEVVVHIEEPAGSLGKLVELNGSSAGRVHFLHLEVLQVVQGILQERIVNQVEEVEDRGPLIGFIIKGVWVVFWTSQSHVEFLN